MELWCSGVFIERRGPYRVRRSVAGRCPHSTPAFLGKGKANVIGKLWFFRSCHDTDLTSSGAMFIKHRGYNCPCLAILTPCAQDESSDLHITRCELQIYLMISAHHLLKGFQKYFMPMRLASVQNYQVLANMWENGTCIILKLIIYFCLHVCALMQHIYSYQGGQRGCRTLCS